MNELKRHLQQTSQFSCFNQAGTTTKVDPVEIIVPIYNGFEALVACLDALLLHTPKDQQITLLNDASTDKNVISHLDKLAVHDNITVINRIKNLGYLTNVNQHLASRKGHVLLLNADTLVSAGWLDEMQRVACDKQVGAVCPLSDNATLLTIETDASTNTELLKQFSGQWYPIPTAVGFCLLIKQQVLQQLGGFDPYYDPGYGEECDYSMLLRQSGWQVACAPAAYVKHLGSQSFESSANQLQQDHQKLLDLRWPGYSPEVTKFLAQNPAQHLDQFLQAKNTAKPRILHVVHGIDNKGGVELFTQELIAQFNDEFEHCVIIPARHQRFHGQPLADESIRLIEIPVKLYQAEHIVFNLPADLKHTALDQYFSQLLRFGNFQLVHFHSLVGVGTQVWPLICLELQIPYFMFVHDHSGLCQIFSLSTTRNNQEVYCGKQLADSNSQQCIQCLSNKTQKSQTATKSYLTQRQEIWRSIIGQAARIQFASDYLKQLYVKHFPQIENHSEVFSPCFYPSKSQAVKPLKNGQINVAFLGQFGILKGAQLFIDLCQSLPRPEINWHIIGGVDPKFRKQLDQTRIKTTGGYDKKRLAHLLADIDLVVFTSQIPETYAITLTEAWVHGIPVVAPDLGAFSHRVKTGKNGFLYEHNNLDSLIQTVKQFIDNSKYESKIKRIDFVQDNQSLTTALQNDYRNCMSTSVNDRTYASSATPHHLPPPKDSAYQVMQQWLDAPMTLEAAADWRNPPAGISVLLLGDDINLRKQTHSNLTTHLESATFILLEELANDDQLGSGLILIVEAGAQINENFGNWVARFSTSSAKLGLADFALHNHHQQPYAPQFQSRFSWNNFDLSHQTVGCVLLQRSAWGTAELMQLLQQTQPLKKLVHKASQTNDISYFPHFSYTLLDQIWVHNWKSNKQQKKSPPTTSHRLLICLESQLPTNKLSWLKKAIQQQTIVTKGHAEVICYEASEKQNILNQVDTSVYTHIMLLYDNIRLLRKDCLELMLRAMQATDLAATSIPAATDRDGTYLIAKKYGAGQYFHGIGRIRDVRFDPPDCVVEYDLLDDDLLLFNHAAWLAVQPITTAPSGFYQALRCSTVLHQQGFKTGIFNHKFLFKQGLPSLGLSAKCFDLGAARQDIIAADQHLPKQQHYSAAYSCQISCDLDLVNVVFKTPKNLPRVVAFAQDDWASGFYRTKSPLNVLAANNMISVQFMSTAHKSHVPTPHEMARMEPDVLLLHGFFADKQLAALHQYRKQLNVRLVISIDDLLTQIPAYNPLAKKMPPDVGTRIRLACSLADTLLVSTEVLAGHFNNLHDDIKVIPNRLSKQLWAHPINTALNGKKLRVGWAGAGQHQADLAWLKDLVEATHEQYDWVFFGDHPKGIDPQLIEFHAPVDLLHYPQKLQQLNLNLAVAPLVNNAFNAAKSNLKLLEFGALGLPVLAADLACYQNSPADTLPSQLNDWINRLKAYDEDRQMLIENGQKMRAWVEQNHWLEDHTSEWMTLLNLNHKL